MVGDYHHPRGVVVTHVVKANIPVSNGVVHLIDKPLVVIDSDIVNFLKVISMFRFHVVLPGCGGQTKRKREGEREREKERTKERERER